MRLGPKPNGKDTRYRRVFMDNQTPQSYSDKVRVALIRAHFGDKEKELAENLADENGHVQGCYHLKPAPVED